MINKQKGNKSALARKLGISRSLLYYEHKRPKNDLKTKDQIEEVLKTHKAYGHKRIALDLNLNKKRILRVMKKFGIKPYRRRSRFIIKKADLNKPPTQFGNLIKDLVVTRPNQVWCTDFTYIQYQGKFIYLATIIDRFTREIVGFSISHFHNRFLVIDALLKALETYQKAEFIHSDQGSEYDSADFVDLVHSQKIKFSMSKKGSPWENGYQESFYGKFKGEFGDFNRFETIGELIEEIYHQIYYYNNQRIHTALKTNPHQFKVNYLLNKATDKLS
jgi:transposase InsO family protein